MTRHIHADLMAEYAKDAQISNTPWEYWENMRSIDKDWVSLADHPYWDEATKYRKKPVQWSPPEGSFYIRTDYNGIFSENTKKTRRNFGLERNDRTTALKALAEIRTFCRLLALRDELCPNFTPRWGDDESNNYVIYYDTQLTEFTYVCYTVYKGYSPYFDEEGAIKACELLNSMQVVLY